MMKKNESVRSHDLASALMPTFHLEADRVMGGISVILNGIISICSLSSEGIQLKSHRGKIQLCGKEMSVSIFENHTVEIVGRIEGIVFEYGKN